MGAEGDADGRISTGEDIIYSLIFHIPRATSDSSS